MRVLGILAVLASSAVALAAPTEQGSRATDLENRGSGTNYPEPKYFRESPHNIHCDRRFADKSLDEHAQRDALRSLIQTYLYTFRELNVQTWLMHGSLLGWWWGKKIMPWDRDADVQISEADIYFLAAYYNMTTYYYKFPGIPEGRVYLLDINPHFEHRDADDRLNVIDARWIDTQTGLFIDITAARYDVDHPRGAGMLYDKNRHEYRDTYLYPLLETTFEGAPVKIPYGYREMLASEYTEKALKNTRYHDHVFDETKMEWVPEPAKDAA